MTPQLQMAPARFDSDSGKTANIKEFFDANGYVIVENVFSETELAPIRARLEAIIADPASAPEGVKIGRENDTLAAGVQSANADNPVRGITFMVRFDPAFQDFARSPKILELTRALIGPRIRVFRDQALQKPPGGQAKPMHQDLSYFRVQPSDELVTAWVALENATPENGCMIYAAGSHKHGLFEITTDPQRPAHHVPDTRGLEIGEEFLCPVPAGAVIFHHGYTLHRSDVNHTQSWRKSVQLHYAGVNALSDVEQLNKEISLEID